MHPCMQVLLSTTTLAFGVDLPYTTEVIVDPIDPSPPPQAANDVEDPVDRPWDVKVFRQVIGRAPRIGRLGQLASPPSFGRCIILVRTTMFSQCLATFGQPSKVESALSPAVALLPLPDAQQQLALELLHEVLALEAHGECSASHLLSLLRRAPFVHTAPSIHPTYLQERFQPVLALLTKDEKGPPLLCITAGAEGTDEVLALTDQGRLVVEFSLDWDAISSFRTLLASPAAANHQPHHTLEAVLGAMCNALASTHYCRKDEVAPLKRLLVDASLPIDCALRGWGGHERSVWKVRMLMLLLAGKGVQVGFGSEVLLDDARRLLPALHEWLLLLGSVGTQLAVATHTWTISLAPRGLKLAREGRGHLLAALAAGKDALVAPAPELGAVTSLEMCAPCTRTMEPLSAEEHLKALQGSCGAFLLTKDEWHSIWNKRGRSQEYQECAWHLVQEAWSEFLPLPVPLNNQVSSRMTQPCDPASYSSQRIMLCLRQDPGRLYVWVHELPDGFYLKDQMDSTERTKLLRQVCKSEFVGEHHEIGGRAAIMYRAESGPFPTEEAAAVGLARAVVRFDGMAALCKLVTQAGASLTCKCQRCQLMAAIGTVIRMLHFRADPTNFDHKGSMTFGGGIRASFGSINASVGHRTSKTSKETLLGGRASEIALFDGAVTAISCALQFYSVEWEVIFMLRRSEYKCAGPIDERGTCCRLMSLWQSELGNGKQILWQQCLRIPNELIQNAAERMRGKNWLERAHSPIPYEFLMTALQTWLNGFANIVQAASGDLTSELLHSRQFNVLIFWLAGTADFPVAIPVEGVDRCAVLQPNVRMRCVTGDMADERLRHATPCHLKIENAWTNMPDELKHWHPFTPDGRLTLTMFKFLQRHKAAHWVP